MSDFLTLNAKKREQTGKGVARRLRATGQVPAVFYDTKGQSIPIELNEKELMKIYGQVKRTAIFNIDIDGKASPALFCDVDYYPAKNKIQHVDVFGVDLNKEIKIRVPLEFTDVAKGTKLGGKLEVYREVLSVIGKPLSLPQKIEVNVAELDINDFIRVEDLKLPAGVKADANTNFVIVGVVLAHGSADEQDGEGAE